MLIITFWEAESNESAEFEWPKTKIFWSKDLVTRHPSVLASKFGTLSLQPCQLLPWTKLTLEVCLPWTYPATHWPRLLGPSKKTNQIWAETNNVMYSTIRHINLIGPFWLTPKGPSLGSWGVSSAELMGWNWPKLVFFAIGTSRWWMGGDGWVIDPFASELAQNGHQFPPWLLLLPTVLISLRAIIGRYASSFITYYCCPMIWEDKKYWGREREFEENRILNRKNKIVHLKTQEIRVRSKKGA